MSFDQTVFQPKPQGSLRPGVRLNGIFEIEALIAEGGMGEVYKGVALASGDAVAIKVVRPDLARDPEVMALFKREAAILHDLLHDAIVRYYVFSLEPELQRYYIAMEFVDGVSLQKRLADGPLSPAEARILLKRIGGALEQAHERGVIHRDISSDNIILPGGDVRKAKIVDFGIARATRPGEGTILGGGFAGKYKYVSPEQVGLMGGQVTPKSDIYSFGLVLAEALRGQPLDMGGAPAEVVEKRRVAPDLSGVDVSLRPLLTAMLAPDPQHRPGSMAEIAAWGEGATQFQAGAPAPAAAAGKRGGAVAAVAAAVVALGAGVGVYLWREPLGLGGRTVVATKPSPPALGPSASPTPAASTAAGTATPAPVTADALLDEMPPKPAHSVVALAPATVGAAYRAELPAFSDPVGKGLVLHAAPGLPAGMTFKALGGGRSEVSGAPQTAGEAAFDVVAVTEAGKSGRMKVALTVNSKPQASPLAQPPQPAQRDVTLEPATAGTAYSAALPPFRSQQAVSLRAGPGLPAGLTLSDLGNGLSQLTGEPKAPGEYAFDVIAGTAGGAEGRMKVRLVVAAPAAETPQTSATPQPTTPAPTTAATVGAPAVTPAAFLRGYPAAHCFAARLSQDDPAGHTLAVVGDATADFERFGAAFKQSVGAEPDLRGYVVRPSQCPAVDFLAAASSPAKGLPRVVLDSPLVGAGRPLSGTILGLGGRPLLLLVIDDDGNAFRLRPQASPGDDSATFSASFTGDPSSIGKPQMVIAVTSDQPIGAGQTIDGARSADLMPKLAATARDAEAGSALFKFVK